jgi:glycosyltransferase involved in cell wall biosynthesis
MRILTVTHYFSTHGGGIEIVAGHLCTQWRGAKHRVLWAASDADPPPDLAGVETVRLRCFNFVEKTTGLPMPILSFSAIRILWRMVRESDVVVIHDALYISSIVTMLAAHHARKPTILVQHIAEIAFANILLRQAMTLANTTITKPMLRAAARVVFISATTRDFYSDVVTKAPAALVFNGVDSNIFHNSGLASCPSIRSMFGIPESAKLCMFAGRFVEKKGLQVLRELARLRPDLHLVLAGRGPINPALWGLSNVTVCGDLPQSSLAMLYRATDVFVLPSIGEGYPLVIQEAMACGLPIICGAEAAKADPGASRWLVGVPVTLNEPKNSAQLVSAAIDGLNMSVEDRAAMAAYAARTYCWKKTAEEVLNVPKTVH